MGALLRRRAHNTGMRWLDALLDELIVAINELVGADVSPAVETIFNDGSASTRRFGLYGFDADGLIAPAVGGAAAIEPLFQALTVAPPGGEIQIRRGGRTFVLLEDASATVARASRLWLSDTLAGTVTTTRPSAGRFSVGRAASSIVQQDGSIGAWLTIFGQSGGGI